jgi:heparan-alpha-glucosaminide N-acetyltransferase
MNQLPKRLHSIDVFRAITMLLMIFVNDVDSVKDIPAWIKHVKANDDGLGFADTVFPAFLFIVGLSLPFAIRNRINKGDSFAGIAMYIITRSLALLVMGFFHVNGENYSSSAVLSRSAWILLITLGFFLIWLDYPPTIAKVKKYSLVGTGIILLVLMAILYKGGDPLAPAGMKPYWWGILGIIGWSYLVCAFIYLITNGKLSFLKSALVLFIIINVASHTGILHAKILVLGDASAVSMMMGGIVIAGIYEKIAGKKKDHYLWSILSAAGIIMIAAGLIIRPYAGGISKIHSTPAWVFICTGISILIFEWLIWLVDLKGKQSWFSFIRPGGTSTLTCYLIPYFLYSILNLVHFHYPPFLREGTGGLIKSFAIAFLVIGLTGVMERYRLRLKI